ncbi:hypothetical protein GGQ86_003001 [Xanthobacter flavus]|uniref:Uncharacterized protein n=1 Tax=Xanthobacter flavus TaxID=281 RepID=A0ABU1KI60_XANFL|nr:hypothetical protein [Xanthobacter flavus]
MSNRRALLRAAGVIAERIAFAMAGLALGVWYTALYGPR